MQFLGPPRCRVSRRGRRAAEVTSCSRWTRSTHTRRSGRLRAPPPRTASPSLSPHRVLAQSPTPRRPPPARAARHPERALAFGDARHGRASARAARGGMGRMPQLPRNLGFCSAAAASANAVASTARSRLPGRAPARLWRQSSMALSLTPRTLPRLAVGCSLRCAGPRATSRARTRAVKAPSRSVGRGGPWAKQEGERGRQEDGQEWRRAPLSGGGHPGTA